jgi:hypothetical protein
MVFNLQTLILNWLIGINEPGGNQKQKNNNKKNNNRVEG